MTTAAVEILLINDKVIRALRKNNLANHLLHLEDAYKSKKLRRLLTEHQRKKGIQLIRTGQA